MRILWLCNIMLPAIARKLELPYSNREGWLTGIYERICRAKERAAGSGNDSPGQAGAGIELGICFPMDEKTADAVERQEKAGGFRLEESGSLCYGFVENLAAPEVYDDRLEGRLKEILEDFKPDMVHIFGTEFPHTLAMVRAFGRPERTLVGIQGLCSACADSLLRHTERAPWHCGFRFGILSALRVISSAPPLRHPELPPHHSGPPHVILSAAKNLGRFRRESNDRK